MAIRNIRHKGLRKLFESDGTRGVRADQVVRLRRILTALDAARTIEDLDLYPGWRLHPLSGDLGGFWSVSVSGNWRIIFRFENGEACDVDLIDYH